MILFIYGAGGAGCEVYDMVVRNDYFNKKYSSVYFVVDRLYAQEGDFYGIKIVHFENCRQYMDQEGGEFVITVGEPSVRKLLAEKVKRAGYSLATLVDQTAVIADTVTMEEGCIVYAYAIISSDTTIHENCLIMFQSIIGHHAVVGKNCVICPKATVGGHSTVGEQTFLGLGSSMIQGAKIGENVIVGLGSMVFRDIPDGATVVGNPARVTKGSENHTVFGV